MRNRAGISGLVLQRAACTWFDLLTERRTSQLLSLETALARQDVSPNQRKAWRGDVLNQPQSQIGCQALHAEQTRRSQAALSM
jgi:hypothetical protein